MTLIHIEALSKHFEILDRREGLGGAFYASQLFLQPEGVSPLTYFSPIVASDSWRWRIGFGRRLLTRIQVQVLNTWI